MNNENQSQQPDSVYGGLSLTFAILSWIVLGIVFAPLSVVFGCISLTRKEKNYGLGIAGLVIGGVACVVMMISWLMLISVAKYI